MPEYDCEELTGEFVSLQSSASTGNTEGSTTSSSPASSVNLITTNTHLSQPQHNTIGNNNNNAPKYGTRVPNRIFVGGISGSTTETELAQLFSGIVYFHFYYTVMYSCTFWPLTMGPLCCLKTSETDYPVICCYIPGECKPQLYHCKKPKNVQSCEYFSRYLCRLFMKPFLNLDEGEFDCVTVFWRVWQ